jgi:hypothetical protein
VTTDAVRTLHQAHPFRPFVIRLDDGKVLPVDQPEFLSYAANSRTMTVYSKDGSFEIVDMLLVTGLEVRDGRAARRGKRR